MNVNKYLQKIEMYSDDSLKKSNLRERLKYDYNSEIITYNDSMHRVIIQAGRDSENNSYYKISAPNEVGLKSGSVFFWDRVGSNYMVVFKRATEKSYFIGQIYEARYEITFINELNKKVKQYGVIKSLTDKLSQTEPETSYAINLIDGDMVLLLEDTEDLKFLLKREKTIKIKNRSWKIVGWDDLTYDNIIAIELVETLNFKEDEADLPYPEKPKNELIISSSLDKYEKISINTALDLEIKTLNGLQVIDDNYEIISDNSIIEDNKIIFNKLGAVNIKIKSTETGIEKNYSIEVTQSESEKSAVVRGRTLIKENIAYSYSILMYDNENMLDKDFIKNNFKLSFIKDDKIKIKTIDSTEFFLIAEGIGKFDILIKLTNIEDENEAYEITLSIESEDILS